MSNLTTEKFIEKAKLKHGDKYNYSLVNYIDTHTIIRIICSIHGVFEQKPCNHLAGCGCQICYKNIQNIDKKYTKNIFIEKSNILHNNKYDYSKVIYINSKTKVKIICKEHGEFEQTPKHHLKGCGCKKCSILYNKEIFETKANLKHNNKYDYSLVNYNNCRNKIKIICSEHGVFEQIPYYHLAGNGCPKCSKSYNKTTEYFINKAKEIHGDKYDYSLVEYKKAKNKVEIICSKHGSFFQRPQDHLSGNGCPTCNNSKGEIEIRKLLSKNNIIFKEQYIFDNCKFKNKLKFDFYLIENELCIEFDGKQHYEEVRHFGGKKTLNEQKIRDEIKNNYCKENNIYLLRIKYSEDIEHKLKEYNII
jgi:hypothetical protein